MPLPSALAPVVTVVVTVLSTLGVPATTQESVFDLAEFPAQATPLPLVSSSTIVSTDGYSNGDPTERYSHDAYDHTHNARTHTSSRIASAGGWQFTVFLDKDTSLVIAKRSLSDPASPTTGWQVHDTGLMLRTSVAGTKGPHDYHHTPSLGIDPDGYLHIAWDHHNDPLRYIRSSAPYDHTAWTSPNTFDGVQESSVTYPHFFNGAGGTLFVTYREGSASTADLMLKRYDHASQTWATESNVIDGYLPPSSADREGAYFGMESNPDDGSMHLFWIWTNTDPNQARDLSYATSAGNHTAWEDKAGGALAMPIRLTTSSSARLRTGHAYAMHELHAQVAYTSDGAVHRLAGFRVDNGLPDFRGTNADLAGTCVPEADACAPGALPADTDAGFELEHITIKDGMATFATVEGGPRAQVIGLPLTGLLEHDDVLYAISLPVGAGSLFVGRSAAPYTSWDWRPVATDPGLVMTWNVDEAQWRDRQTLSLYVAERASSPYVDSDEMQNEAVQGDAAGLQAEAGEWADDTADGEERTGPVTSPILRVIDIVDVPGQFAAAPRPTI